MHHPLAHRFQFGRFQDRRDHRRQRVRDDALGLVRIGGPAHGQVRHEVLALAGEAAHQIQHRIDDPPGHVAPERADEHGANIIAAGVGDAQRPGEREDHDQSEEDFRDAINRVQDSLRRSCRVIGHIG